MRKERLISEVLGGASLLSPSDVCNKEFPSAVVGGYARREVKRFLGQVADVLEVLTGKTLELKTLCEEQKALLTDYRQMETSLHNALASAQKFSTNLVDAAEKEAQNILEQARLEQARFTFEAEKLPGTLQHEIAGLQAQRDRFRTEFLAILETHKQLLDRLIPSAPDKGAPIHLTSEKSKKETF